MTFANPAALWFLALAVPVLALHVLRSRRVEVPVSSTFAWEPHDRPVAAARPWQRLRWSIPLVLQLLLVALLAGALARPVWDTGRVSAQNLVVIVDTSASMGATDGSPTRLASARAEAAEAAAELGDGARVSLIAAGAPARLVASDLPPSALGAALESLEVSDGGYDGTAASALALSLDRPDRSTAYLLVSDGGLSGADVSLLPPGTDAALVGRRATNLGITNVVVSAGAEGPHVQALVANSGDAAMTTEVRADVDGVEVDSVALRVPAHGSAEVGLDVVDGEEIAVRLASEDLLFSDDTAWALGPTARSNRVLWLGGDNPYLDALLGGRSDVEVTHLAAVPESGYEGYDLVVLDGVEIGSPPPIPWLAVAPPGGAPGVEVAGAVERPVPALVRHDDVLLSGLDLSELVVATAQRIDAPAATTVVGAEQTPLLVSGSSDGVPFVYLAFSLEASNLGLLPSFPVLGDRILTQLGGTDLAAGDSHVGDSLPATSTGDTVVESPSGARTEVPAGQTPPELDRTGIWTVTSATGNVRKLVVNPPPEESAIAPRTGLAIPGVAGGLGGEGAPVLRSFVPWLLVAALGCVAVEWWFSARRRGVSRRQWRVAQVARGVVAALLVLGLVAPAVTRSSSQVATVFVLDLSDSTAGGRAAAIETMQRGIDAMPAGSEAGVVVVGSDARVDSSMSGDLAWAGPRVRVDGSATDLAAGVRIAAAVAPSSHARRVVLVSDGRPTVGDLDAEITRLRRAGIHLDVVPVRTVSSSDVLVRAVEVPDRARSTDQVDVRVRIATTAAQLVSVVLHRDGVEVDRRVVDAPAGDSEVVFVQPAGEPGTRRWTATVAGPANGLPQNDRGRATTRVEGRPQVLLVDGAPGEGTDLAAVLAASGAAVERVDPEALPDLAGLATADAIVLVDVPVSSLTSAQLDSLITATRELGTGLVTVGGTASYGAGDYLGSRLEELLPVTSEVKDPKRRSKVAQVFAVDVSGSMGACHCAEGGTGESSRLAGGVEKTDIAREAAMLALEGIHPTDELGVLALDDSHRWLLDLAPLGDGADARRQLDGVKRSGDDWEAGTNLSPSLSASAERLRGSDASLRHIVLFTDGFEEPQVLADLAAEAAELRDEGITVSVMGTGEGSAAELRSIADAGGGRFYPGRDLHQLPDLLLQETKVVARQMIVEGEFLPEITSQAPVVASLESAPVLGGYVATTVKPTATQHLRVGDERDPLLASWQVGLGRVVSWTSDAGGRWAGGWTSWDGAPSFWAGVIRSVFTEPAGGLQVRFDGASATLTATFDQAMPDGADVRAVVSTPGGGTETIGMRRVDDRTFEGTFDTGPTGTYGIGVTATTGDGRSLGSVTGTAELGYSREYSGEATDVDYLQAVSLRSGGRGAVGDGELFAAGDLTPGRRTIELRGWLLALALVLWPIVVALSRLRFASGPDAQVRSARFGRAGEVARSIAGSRSERRTDPPDPPRTGSGPPAPTPSAPQAAAPPVTDQAGESTAGSDSTLDSLLAAKRRRRD